MTHDLLCFAPLALVIAVIAVRLVIVERRRRREIIAAAVQRRKDREYLAWLGDTWHEDAGERSEP